MLSRRTALSTIGGLAALALSGIVQPASAADQTIRVAIVTGPTHQMNIALNWFAKRVEKRNVGLTIQVLGGGQLGGERDYIEGMTLGSIQMAQVSTAPLSQFIPQFDLFSLPYLFNSTDQFKHVVSGPVAKEFDKLAQKRGMKILAWFDNGYRDVFNKDHPVVTPKDMKGLKIRVMESPLMVNTLDDMGASATPMSYSELYTALEQGVVDGAENAPGNILNDKFYEVTGYLSLTRHFRPPGVVAISLMTWNSLTPEQQKVMTEEAAAMQDYEIALTAKVEHKAIEELKAKGMKVNKADIAAFRAKMKPIYADYVKKHGDKLLKMVENTK